MVAVSDNPFSEQLIYPTHKASPSRHLRMPCCTSASAKTPAPVALGMNSATFTGGCVMLLRMPQASVREMRSEFRALQGKSTNLVERV